MIRQCPCGRKLSHTLARSAQFYTDYCSHYCYHYYQNPSAYPMVKVSDSKHHSNIWRKPDIHTNCDWCGTQFSLRDNRKLSNTNFCQNSCQHTALKGKNSRRDWRILKMIKIHPNKTAGQLARLWTDDNQPINANSIGCVLRVYVARGIVDAKTDDGCNQKIYQLSQAYLDSDIPLGRVVKDKIRLKEA